MPKDAAALFRETFEREPEVTVLSPGRVNLMGEHTDYNGGHVMPMAIDKGISVALGLTKGQCRAVSDLFGEANADLRQTGRPEGWVAHLIGMCRALGIDVGFEAAVTSGLPAGAGLSSSASLATAFGMALLELKGEPYSLWDLALAAQRSEHETLNVQCGIMDQLACCFGRAGHALYIDTLNLGITHVAIPKSAAFLVLDTGKSRALEGSDYNQRRQECDQAAKLLGVDLLVKADQDWALGDNSPLSGVLMRRAQHFFQEEQRCKEFAARLDEQDLNLAGILMDKCHLSLRNNFQVSCVELNTMAEVARSAPGTLGAKMTGAGFGGACVVLTQATMTDSVLLSALERYRQTFPEYRSDGFQVRPSNGVRRVDGRKSLVAISSNGPGHGTSTVGGKNTVRDG